MAYGLRVENEEGHIQIDQDYSSLYLHEKITVTTVETGVDNFSNDVSFARLSIPSGAFISAISCYENSAPYFAFNYDGQKIYTYLVWAPVGTSFTYYVFGSEPPAASNGFGLEVYKDDGTVAFSSNYNYYKPVDSFAGSSEAVFIAGSIELDSTRDYAVSASRAPWRKTVAGTHLLANQNGVVKRTQSGFSFGYEVLSYFATGGEARYSTAADSIYNYLVIDVTGF